MRPQPRTEEVREVSGAPYPGILGTERGTSYDAKDLPEVKQQDGLSHLPRSLDAGLETKRGQARGFGAGLSSLVPEANALDQAFHAPEKQRRDYDRCVRVIEVQGRYPLRERGRPVKDADNERLRQDLRRHQERGNLLRFLPEPP